MSSSSRFVFSRWGFMGLLILAMGVLCPSRSWSQERTPPTQQQPQEKPKEPAECKLPAEWLKPLTWRCIGPANMSGRIVAISVYEADPSIWWVATASGGLLKTTNNGVTFEHQFDGENTVSIGDVCVAPSDPKIVWVGTGENNPRNSVSYGDGVYKSIDGGKSWENMGLKKSFQIGRIAVHPKNPDVVYVGALGRLYGTNEERGLFKTNDGGKSWDKILYIDDKTGVIDMQMHPTDPETLLVATYERQRDGFDTNDPAKKLGDGSGLYKTTDGGKSFKKLTRGLPTCKFGRIGIDYYRKNPDTIFIVLESEKIGMGPPPAYVGISGREDERGALLTRITPDGPAAKAGLKEGDLVVALGDKPVRSYRDLLTQINKLSAGDKVKVTCKRDKETKVLELTFGARPGTSATHPHRDRLGGQGPNAQEQQGKDGYQYGGVYKSTDGGESWTRINSVNPRPMYFSQVRVDPNDERYLYVLGIALYRSRDGGKTFTPDGGRGVHADQHALWIDPRDGRHMILGTDGGFYVSYDRMDNWDHLNTAALGQFYHVAIDTRRLYWAYGGLQDNGTWGGPSMMRGSTGPINEDWIRVGGGDGFMCRVDPKDPDQIYFTMQNGGLQRRNLRTREYARISPPRGQRYRFNWNTPFILSHHNSRIYYAAGNVVFQSLDRGNDLRAISPEITRTNRGSATALAESPKNANVLYVGTDDGALWVTRNGGKDWTDITKNVGLPGPRWVATIEASRFEEGRAYVAFDGHRSDDDDPHVYVTEDFGKTWTSLRSNLPWGSTRCLREDIESPNLLYLGTEFACWCSLDRGKTWNKLNAKFPTVAVHEIAIHPTAGEIVAATHGRSLWILDVTPLRQISADALKSTSVLCKPVTAIRWVSEPSRGGTNRRFVGENPPSGAQLYYSLAERAENVSLKVMDINGKVLISLPTEKERGLHKLRWDLRLAGPPPAPRQGQGRRPPQGFGRPRGQLVPEGTYRIVLTVDGKEQSRILKIETDPTAPNNAIVEDEPELKAAEGEPDHTDR